MDLLHVGKRIAKFRKQLNMTQANLAEAAHMSNTHLSHIETAKTTMSLDALVDLCNALKVTPNDLLYGEYENQTAADEFAFMDTADYVLSPDDERLLQTIIQNFYSIKGRKK